jgi:hypothetical protein
MKKEDLIKLGIEEETVQKIIILHGQDIESHKTKLTTAQTEAEGLKAQLTEANKAIEGFKGMDIEGVKKSADEWKTKAEQAAVDAQKQVASLKFDYALDGALTGAKAKNLKAVRSLLSNDVLKLNEDGSILGLKEQLEKIKSENDYLFESDTPTPKIVTGGNSKSILGDPMVDAMRKAAGLPVQEGK